MVTAGAGEVPPQECSSVTSGRVRGVGHGVTRINGRAMQSSLLRAPPAHSVTHTPHASHITIGLFERAIRDPRIVRPQTGQLLPTWPPATPHTFHTTSCINSLRLSS